MRDDPPKPTVSVVLAAGKGSRMRGYDGNKTLLPLRPGGTAFEGTQPLLLEVLQNLPEGPVGIVVHHCADAVIRATAGYPVAFVEQPTTNGTGGALLVARPFLEARDLETVIITMGDVPLIRHATYVGMIRELAYHAMVVLGFEPSDRAQYGMLEMDGEKALRIVEWKYWHLFEPERRERLRFCNAGVYAVRRPVLLEYLQRLVRRPHVVQKQRGDAWVAVEEYFVTDLVEMISGDGLSVGVVLTSEEEVMGVDTPEALKRAQNIYARMLVREQT
jgi:bifunctional UDP-N-acetylglucosamine pyrophosphorylase / glucosamine-1-phosphate N-acetyltransferase